MMGEELRDAAIKYSKAYKKFKTFVDEQSAKGILIPRYGDTPEWKPFEEARENLLETARSINEENPTD